MQCLCSTADRATEQCRWRAPPSPDPILRMESRSFVLPQFVLSSPTVPDFEHRARRSILMGSLGVSARSHFALELARDEIRVQIEKCDVLQLVLSRVIEQLP